MINNKNHLPYFLIVIMALMLYVGWGKLTDAKDEAMKAERIAEQATYNMGVIQNYNEQRFDELTKVKGRGWESGKHKAKF